MEDIMARYIIISTSIFINQRSALLQYIEMIFVELNLLLSKLNLDKFISKEHSHAGKCICFLTLN